MAQIARDILASAMALPEDDRAAMADELMASVEPVDDSDELHAELDQRAAELRADPSQGLTWDEVRSMR